MPYANESERYKLPTPGLGDIINPDDESRFAKIIDNQLFGSIRAHSGGTGVIRNGPLALLLSDDGSYTVIIYENKAAGLPVMEGFINQIYVYTEESLRWENLANDTTYYLFVQLVEVDDDDSSLRNKQMITSFNTTGDIPDDGLLIATVSISEPGNTAFVTDPAGRVEVPILGDHMGDNQNPHGNTLFQDDIVVSGLSVLDFLRFADLQVESLTISGNSLISGNITVLQNLIVSGKILNAGNITFNQIIANNFEITGKFVVADLQVSSGLDVYSPSLFRQDIQLTSGVKVDGVDPSEFVPLIEGDNVDNLHGHVLGSIAAATKPIPFAPEYCDTVTSGAGSENGVFFARRVFNNNYYEWQAITSGAAHVITRVRIPDDFDKWDRVVVAGGVGNTLSGSNIRTTVLDKDDNEAVLSNPQNESSQIINQTSTISGGQFLPTNKTTIINSIYTASGIMTNLGDMVMWYVPKQGEKVIFDWNFSGQDATEHFDGLRVAPCDLRTEKVLAAQSIALSGYSVFDIGTGAVGVEPSTVFNGTPKLELPFGSGGASYQGGEQEIITTINGGEIISASIDLIASGSKDASVQLVTHRI